MLSNLLPGIRQIRTPLATGFLWLLVFWLWLPMRIKNGPSTSGVLGDIENLAHYGGRISVSIALGFTAYLIGALSQVVNSPFVRLGTNVTYSAKFIDRTEAFRNTKTFAFGNPRIVIKRISLGISLSAPKNHLAQDAYYKAENQQRATLSAGQMSAKGIASLQNFASKTAEMKSGNKEAFKFEFLTYLLREVPNEGNALIGKETKLYSAYDRLISEGEFRIGISIPLTALFATLAIRWSPWWIFAILPLLVLLVTGSQQRIAAGDLLANAVRQDRIEITLPAWLIKGDEPYEQAIS